MMNKIVLALVGCVALTQATSAVYDIGTDVGNFNLGVCLAFQDDSTDTSTTCYASCVSTASYIQSMFDVTQYTNSAFNTPQIIQFAQTMEIQFLTEFNDCHLMEFLYAINNRLSDPAFYSGTAANLATQISTVVGYYYGSTSTTGTVSTILLSLFNKSTLIITYNTVYADIVALDFQKLGLDVTQFILSLVNYKAPNVNTNRSTM